MSTIITKADLEPFADIEPAKADAMIADATATALRVAPCLIDINTDQLLLDAAKAVLRRAILRWHEGGAAGSVTQQSAGPFQQSIDVRRPQGLFWPSEIEELQGLCRGASDGAFTVDTLNTPGSIHVPWCSLHFGATFCSCGADIAGEPIYENKPGL